MNIRELQSLDEALDYLNEENYQEYAKAKKKKDDIANDRIRTFNNTHKTHIPFARNGSTSINKNDITKKDLDSLCADIRLKFAQDKDIKIYNVGWHESNNHKYYVISF